MLITASLVGRARLAHHEAWLAMLLGLGLGHHDVGTGLLDTVESATLLWQLFLHLSSLPHGEGCCFEEYLQPAISRCLILYNIQVSERSLVRYGTGFAKKGGGLC